MKFRKDLSDLILAGEKTTTWRLFDDKDLQEGDLVRFVIWETSEEFAQARLVKVYEKKFGSIEEKDQEGHETFPSKRRMYETFAQYYDRPVDENTMAKIIHFVLL